MTSLARRWAVATLLTAALVGGFLLLTVGMAHASPGGLGGPTGPTVSNPLPPSANAPPAPAATCGFLCSIGVTLALVGGSAFLLLPEWRPIAAMVFMGGGLLATGSAFGLGV